jgi:hypothetical protein
MKKQIWQCKIGEHPFLPSGADAPMRAAVQDAYKKLTGEYAQFCFSGWGATLDECERAVVENRPPAFEADSHSLEDGKYIIRYRNGILSALRHGEPWPAADEDLLGNKLVGAMFDEISRLKTELLKYGAQ